MNKTFKVVAVLLTVFVAIVAVAHVFNLHGVLRKLHGG
jgi:hypothetical protein